MRIPRLSIFVAIIGVIGLSACGPRPAGETVPTIVGDGVPIQVEHNAPVTTSLTIYLIDGMGTRHVLGTVQPNQLETFMIEEPATPGPIRLIAEGAPGRAMASRPIHLTVRDGVRWILSTNTITSVVGEPGGLDEADVDEP
jgi:hypothetical protein